MKNIIYSTLIVAAFSGWGGDLGSLQTEILESGSTLPNAHQAVSLVAFSRKQKQSPWVKTVLSPLSKKRLITIENIPAGANTLVIKIAPVKGFLNFHLQTVDENYNANSVLYNELVFDLVNHGSPIFFMLSIENNGNIFPQPGNNQHLMYVRSLKLTFYENESIVAFKEEELDLRGHHFKQIAVGPTLEDYLRTRGLFLAPKRNGHQQKQQNVFKRKVQTIFNHTGDAVQIQRLYMPKEQTGNDRKRSSKTTSEKSKKRGSFTARQIPPKRSKHSSLTTDSPPAMVLATSGLERNGQDSSHEPSNLISSLPPELPIYRGNNNGHDSSCIPEPTDCTFEDLLGEPEYHSWE